MEENIKKKISFSAIQPSGTPTIGNYFGALKNWAALQEEFDCIYAIADLHALTVRQEPAELRKRTLSAISLAIACGIDPSRSLLFVQSHVHTHAELAWILNCWTPFGELSRMTQFKDKSQSHSDNVNAGLFDYPVLMAADILLYNADVVPIGSDQKQHLELARNIAVRFNGSFPDVFTVPEPYMPKQGARVMSLQDPAKKMSKSDANPNAYVSMLDDRDTIVRKFKRAVTDSGAEVRRGEGKDGINSLIDIYCAASGASPEQVEREFEGKGYGEFKLAVGEAVADVMDPIRAEYERLMADKAYLEKVCADGADAALYVSGKTLRKVYKKVGLLPRV